MHLEIAFYASGVKSGEAMSDGQVPEITALIEETYSLHPSCSSSVLSHANLKMTSEHPWLYYGMSVFSKGESEPWVKVFLFRTRLKSLTF